MSLNVTNFKSAEYVRNTWSAVVDHGFPPASLTDPIFWAHVANMLKVDDRVEVRPESREWFAEVYVLETGANFARVALLHITDMTAAQDAGAADADFSIEWKGPSRKWSVIRKSDKAPIYDGLPSKDAALAKLTAHVRPQAA